MAGNRFSSDHMAGGRAQSLVFGVLPSGFCGRPGSASQSTKGHEHGVRVFPLGCGLTRPGTRRAAQMPTSGAELRQARSGKR